VGVGVGGRGTQLNKGRGHVVAPHLMEIITNFKCRVGEELRCNWIRRAIAGRAPNSLWLCPHSSQARANIGENRSRWCVD
jgi:hypothetical protein